MDEIAQIGRCEGCRKPGRLKRGACAACARTFGEGCGPIFRAIRSKPSLARKCYQMLRSDAARARFSSMFSDIAGVPSAAGEA